MKESTMNQEKLNKLQAQVRIGGKVSWITCWQITYSKFFFMSCSWVMGSYVIRRCCALQGSARRKKKVVHRTATADDKKLQFSLKKLGVNNISGIEEVHQILSEKHSNDWTRSSCSRVKVFNLKKYIIEKRKKFKMIWNTIKLEHKLTDLHQMQSLNLQITFNRAV